MTAEDARAFALTVAVAAAGAGLAYAASVPAPYLVGPAVAVTAASLRGMRTGMPGVARDAAFLVIGLAMGTGVTPEVLQEARSWPGSLLLLALAVLTMIFAGAAVMRRAFGMDRNTAMLCATPGHLSFTILLSMEVGGETRRVVIIQSLRVLSLVVIVPLLVAAVSDRTLGAAIPFDGAPLTLPHLAILLAAALALGHGFKLLRAPAAMLLGAMFVSAIGHGSGLTPGAVPGWLSVSGFVLLGALIGTRFAGVTMSEVIGALGAVVVLTTISALVAVAGALVAAWAFGVSLTSALIAFAPGGLETMAALAVLLDADIAYVAAHHVGRLMFLAAILPLLVRAPRPPGGQAGARQESGGG